MKPNETTTREYVLSEPRLRRWIAQCIRCQQLGYRTDTPPQWRPALAKLFPELRLNDDGLCPVCERHAAK
jgi:hypothetical protein